MNVAENLLLQQMQTMANLPKTGNTGKQDQAGSFQDMMNQAGKDNTVDSGKEPSQPGRTEKPDSPQENPKAPVQKKDGEAETQVDPSAAVLVMDLFRPEIVDVQPEAAEEAVAAAVVELVSEAAPVVEEAAAEIPVMEETAAPVQVQEEAAPAAEIPVETRETAVQETPEAVVETAKPVETEKPVEAPGDTGADEVEKATTETGELREVRPTEETAEDDELQGEAAELPNQVFHDVKAAPIKVAEHYEPVDTQEPEMDSKLANTILDAADNGVERMQIQLTPANLGRITIDLARDAGGALEVVIHAATNKAAGLLNQHLDGLHAALQSYGNNQTVHVEVQRGQEGQEQHMFQQADPDGRGQQHQQRQEERRETEDSGEDFLQKLRLGLTGLEN